MQHRLRKTTNCFILLILIWNCLSCSSLGNRRQQSLLTRDPEQVEYKAPDPVRWKLKNGLEVLYYHDEELPLIDGMLLIKGGSIWEPANQPGVLAAMGSQMREGGAGDLSPQSIDRTLESLAASISTGFDNEMGSITFSCLSADFERVFDLFALVTLEPSFDQARFDLWKGNQIEGIRRRKDDPDTIASLAFSELIYGESPYGKVLDTSDVKAITRLDMLRAHRHFVRPDQAILVVTGALSRQALQSAIEKKFANWNPRGSKFSVAPPVTHEPQPGIYFLEFPFEQATLYMGHLGVPRLTEDYPAIDIFNRVFGSGAMSTRLMQEVRADRGLAYGVSGAISPGVVKGQNWIYLQTKAETAGEALEASFHTLKEMQDQLIRPEELQETKQAIQNSFVFRFDSPAKALQRRAFIQLLEYPEDYDETYIPLTSQVSLEDIRQVAARRWNLEKFVVVVVGNNTAYLSLKRLFENNPELLPGGVFKKISFDEKIRL